MKKVIILEYYNLVFIIENDHIIWDGLRSSYIEDSYLLTELLKVIPYNTQTVKNLIFFEK